WKPIRTASSDARPSTELMKQLNRREMMKFSVAGAALAFLELPLSTFGFPEPEAGATLIPFLDIQPMNPKRPMLKWENLQSWITPTEQIFSVSHYGQPTVDLEKWNLELSGLVKKPR